MHKFFVSFIFIFSLFPFCILAETKDSADLLTIWQIWKVKHNKFYSSSEETLRYSIFLDNYNRVQSFNSKNNLTRLAVNKFADKTAEEFRFEFTNSASFSETNPSIIKNNTVHYSMAPGEYLPTSVDWRNVGAVTKVKDQLCSTVCCLSDWAFSTTGLLEAFYFINNGTLLSFSEQQLVDCDKNSNACKGGSVSSALSYVAANGIELESDYPVTGGQGKCQYHEKKATFVSSGYQFLTPNDTDQLKLAVIKMPISVMVEADQDIFRFYSSGVIYWNCGPFINHSVLIIGFQKMGVLEAFIVKNSWGTHWGDSGYVYISTNQKINDGSGVCGILKQPIIPLMIS